MAPDKIEEVLDSFTRAAFNHSVRISALECILKPMVRRGAISTSEALAALEEVKETIDPLLIMPVEREILSIMTEASPAAGKA